MERRTKKEYPLRVTVENPVERFQYKFAKEALAKVKLDDRIKVDASHVGLTISAVYEQDIEKVVDQLKKSFPDLVLGKLRIMYIEGPPALEPYMDLTVLTPAEFVGAICADLNQRNAVILHIGDAESAKVVKSEAPLSEILGYAHDLRHMTSGRGSFRVDFCEYKPAHGGGPGPQDVA